MKRTGAAAAREHTPSPPVTAGPSSANGSGVVPATPQKDPAHRRSPSPPPLPPKKARQRRAATTTTPAVPPREEAPAAESSPSPPLGPNEEVERRWQLGRDIVEALLSPLKVDCSAVTLLPDKATLEAFRAGAQAWLNQNGCNPQLNYSNKESFAEQMARFLFQLTLSCIGGEGAASAGGATNVTGCAVWVQAESHVSAQEAGTSSVIRCYHNEPMVARDHTVEMDVTSEAGKRALEEQPDRARVTQNRWGRNVVRLTNPDALCCKSDVALAGGAHSAESCGMFFTDGPKLRLALAQSGAYQAACYPSMREAHTRLLAVLRCRCNWHSCASRRPVVQLGRQVCRVSPFQLSAAAQLNPDSFEDPRYQASIRYPALLVFQCCNPVFRRGGASGGGRGAEAPTCDWKLSAPDLLNAVQLAKRMWSSVIGDRYPLPTLRIPELRWHDSLRYQTALLPQPAGDVEEAESPFE